MLYTRRLSILPCASIYAAFSNGFDSFCPSDSATLIRHSNQKLLQQIPIICFPGMRPA